MKKSTAVFLLLFAALLAYVLYMQKHRPAGTSPSGGSQKIFSVTADQIRSIQITRGKETVVLARSGPTDWMLQKPLVDRADHLQAESLADSVASLTAEEVVSRDENPAAYGLAKSSMTVTVTSSQSAPQEVRIGDESPTHQGCYAFVPSSGEVVLIPTDFQQELQTPVEDWRDHLILHVNVATASKVEVKMKGRDFVLAKNGGTWSVESPEKEKADQAKVSDWLNTLASSRLNGFLAAGAHTVPHPQVVLSVWQNGASAPQTVAIGAKTPQGFPASGGRAFGYTVGGDFVSAVTQDPASFEDLHIFDFDEKGVTKLIVTKGTSTTTFEKKGTDWQVTSGNAQGWKADIIVNDVKGLLKARVPGSPPPVAAPRASVSLWSGNALTAQLAIGAPGPKGAYPVTITTQKQTVYADADLLVKDLP